MHRRKKIQREDKHGRESTFLFIHSILCLSEEEYNPLYKAK